MIVKFDHILDYEEFELAVKDIAEDRSTWMHFELPQEEVISNTTAQRYISYCDRLALVYEFIDDTLMIVRLPHRVAIDKYYQNKFNKTNQRNSMGCDENWYDCYYAITQTLHPNEVDEMSDDTLDAVVRLVCEVQEALY